ncbi:NAD(P)/FAD-dependent oxidoreductase [Streptomyces sp. HUAS MG47]|uniref:flavin monoamine oxidase family protein n=1 Tax=Streptomyces solicamelliae TaxID=3231716 RepID=UPI003877C0C5
MTVENHRTDFDAIVVGAGFAGVTAARELRARGRRVLLLEARDRLGGRTWTDTFAGQQIELGGAWVHWSQPHIWTELTRYGVPVVEDAFPERIVLPTEGEQRSYELIDAYVRITELLNKVFEGTELHFPRPHDPLHHADQLGAFDALSLQDRLDQLDLTPDEITWISGLLATELGGSTERGAFSMLAQWWALGMLNQRGYYSIVSLRPRTGMTGLLEKMVEDNPPEIRLDSPVTSIDDHGDGVTVTTRSGERFTARTAVVAVPTNMWRTIDFPAGLPNAHAAVAATGLGVPHGSKLWLHLRGDLDNFMAQGPQGAPLSVLFPHSELGDGRLMIAFSVDPELDLGSFAAVEKAVQLLEPKAELVDYRVQDWGRDEFSQGGWGNRPPRHLTTVHRELQQPHGRLTFASGDIADGWAGCIDGAVESGLKAAHQSAALLNTRA